MIKKTFFLLALIIAPAACGMDADDAAPDRSTLMILEQRRNKALSSMKKELLSTNECIQSITDSLNSTHPRISNWTRQNYEEELPELQKKRDLLQLKIWEQEPPTNDLDRGMMLLLKKVHSK